MSTRPDPPKCGGDSHRETPSPWGNVGLARAHPLTKTLAMDLVTALRAAPARLSSLDGGICAWRLKPTVRYKPQLEPKPYGSDEFLDAVLGKTPGWDAVVC